MAKLFHGFLEGILQMFSMSSNNTADIFLGVWPTYSNNFYGAIDDVGIWKRELLDCEIWELYYTQAVDTSVTVTESTLTSNESTAIFYQWLDCNNGFSTIPGATNQSFTPLTSGNYAVNVGVPDLCYDTSDCFNVTIANVPEVIKTEKHVVKITDLLGRETENKPNSTMIYIYSDGTKEKVYRIK